MASIWTNGVISEGPKGTHGERGLIVGTKGSVEVNPEFARFNVNKVSMKMTQTLLIPPEVNVPAF